MNHTTALDWEEKLSSLGVPCNVQNDTLGNIPKYRSVHKNIEPEDFNSNNYYIIIGTPNHAGHWSGIIYDTSDKCQNIYNIYTENQRRRYENKI